MLTESGNKGHIPGEELPSGPLISCLYSQVWFSLNKNLFQAK